MKNNIRRDILDTVNRKTKNRDNVHIDVFHKALYEKIRQTRSFFKNNDQLYVSKADKGNNCTVIIDKTESLTRLKLL